MITFEEFKKTVYYTEKKIVLPLLNIRLDKINFMIKGVLNHELINSKLRSIFEDNIIK